MDAQITIREACDRVLGRDAASAIIDDMGLHWCVVAAMAGCKISHGPAVKTAIARYVENMKRQTGVRI